MNLSQEESQKLFELPKKYFEEYKLKFPQSGEKLSLECYSDNKRYVFQADINRKGIIKPKLGFQNRYNKIFILRRLDMVGSPHTNPPDSLDFEFLKPYENMNLGCPHLHIY